MNFFTFNKSVMGHIHVIKDIPCQDYSISYSDKDGKYQIAIISDGHGDPSCLRSEIGSRLACEIAEEDLKKFAQTYTNMCEVSKDENDMLHMSADIFLKELKQEKSSRLHMKRLTDSIISKWFTKIHEHYSENPLSLEQLERLNIDENATDFNRKKAHLYGCTLIASLRVADMLILLQQGDGRCTVFYDDGTYDQPIPWDDRCHENVTTSMCDSDAGSSIRHKILYLDAKDVIASFVASDGVEDSYVDMEGTYTFFKRLMPIILSKSASELQDYLEKYLPEFSSNGSGDDISISGILNFEKISPFLNTFENEAKAYELQDNLNIYENKLNSMARKYEYLKNESEKAKKLSSQNTHEDIRRELSKQQIILDSSTEKKEDLEVKLAHLKQVILTFEQNLCEAQKRKDTLSASILKTEEIIKQKKYDKYLAQKEEMNLKGKLSNEHKESVSPKLAMDNVEALLKNAIGDITKKISDLLNEIYIEDEKYGREMQEYKSAERDFLFYTKNLDEEKLKMANIRKELDISGKILKNTISNIASLKKSLNDVPHTDAHADVVQEFLDYDKLYKEISFKRDEILREIDKLKA